jgi:phosphohistidine swiveling domain-containing protein
MMGMKSFGFSCARSPTWMKWTSIQTASRERFSPGQIKPLIWSVNIPLVNGAWIDLFTEMIGPNDLRAENLAKSFGYRAYFNMGAIGQVFNLLGFPRDLLEHLLGLEGGAEKPRFRPTLKTFRHLPRMLSFAARKWRLDSTVLPSLHSIRQEYNWFTTARAAQLDELQLLDQVDRLYEINRKAAAYNIIIPLMMSAYDGLFRRQLSRMGIDFAAFDLTSGLEELNDYNPNLSLTHLASQFQALEGSRQAAIRAAVSSGQPVLDVFAREMEDFLHRFGHLSDSGNDFSSVPWRETPSLVWQMLFAEVERLSQSTVQAQAPGEPQASIFSGSVGQADRKIDWRSLRTTPLRRLFLRPFYHKARRFRLYREAVSATYTYGYGLFRIFFLELGRQFAASGVLDQPTDIYYLSWEEVRQLVKDKLSTGTNDLAPRDKVEHRKAEMQASARMVLPEIIYGDALPPTQGSSGNVGTLKGIPSSRGYAQGTVRVIRSVAEFNRLSEGDVLVIPYSDVSWTPLFTRARAVIAESGGILSHSSIVAREYNLPCVVSVTGACDLPEGQIVSVDGYLGLVTLLQTQPGQIQPTGIS